MSAQRVRRVDGASPVQAEGPENFVGHLVRFFDAGQIRERHHIEVGGALRCGLQRKSGLPHAPRPRQGDQAVLVDQSDEFVDLVASTHEARRGDREVPQRRRGG